ncbi:MAG: (2Fe-2S)-binding protein [Ekhidna sp.]
MKVTFQLNGRRKNVDVQRDTKLLWYLREHLGLTGTKYGCGIAQCGACTIHLDGLPVKACMTFVAALEGRSVTTIEGLSEDGPHPLQKMWIEEQVPQCGYCQSGQLMQAAALLKQNSKPTLREIQQSMDNVLCRCGTYYRINKAIQKVVDSNGNTR